MYTGVIRRPWDRNWRALQSCGPHFWIFAFAVLFLRHWFYFPFFLFFLFLVISFTFSFYPFSFSYLVFSFLLSFCLRVRSVGLGGKRFEKWTAYFLSLYYVHGTYGIFEYLPHEIAFFLFGTDLFHEKEAVKSCLRLCRLCLANTWLSRPDCFDLLAFIINKCLLSVSVPMDCGRGGLHCLVFYSLLFFFLFFSFKFLCMDWWRWFFSQSWTSPFFISFPYDI